MNTHVFREYDIRGVEDADLNDDFVEQLGRGIGTYLAAAQARRLVLGRDCRTHSPRIHDALLRGLLSTGLQVTDIGVAATPLLYFAAFHFDADGGVQITGSHNPPEYNGFKVLRGKTTIYGDEIQAIRRLMERGQYAAGAGEARVADVLAAYQAKLRESLRMGARRFPIVVDAGNGTGGVALVPLLRGAGFEVRELYCEMDGRFPHHHPDPTVPANLEDLCRVVGETSAELGIALDGDADRLGAVDAQGRIIWGDQLMILFARAILAEVPGATFVSEVKASQALYDDIAAHGGRSIMWRVGHSLIKAKMKEEHALLAGEMSGHIFFAHRYLGYDDAIYAGSRLVELLSRSPQTLAELVDGLPAAVNTPELRVDCPDDVKFPLVAAAVRRFRERGLDVVDVDGARVRFPDGWGLVRASNTQPALVLRFEARNQTRLREIRALVEGELDGLRRELAAGLKR